MYKKILFLLIIFSIFFTKTAYAGTFNLKSIGQLDTSGQQISHWWYTGSTPILIGEAAAGSSVSVSVDGTATTVTADGSGNWTSNPGSLAAGDHKIILTSGGSTINFTLTLGAENANWDVIGKSGGATLPTAGATYPTLILISMAGILFLTAKRLAKQD
jgi:hypothetical protein